MLESIKQLLKALDENNITYCHWKSNEHLKPALEGDTDLDMLFLPEERVSLEKVLSNCGLKRFRTVPRCQYNAIEDFIGYDSKKAKIWHLHLHYRMTLGEKNLKGYTVNTWGKYILHNRVYSKLGCYTSMPEDELILLYVRMALKLRISDYFFKTSMDDIIELKWLKNRINIETLKKEAYMFCGKRGCKEILKLFNMNLTHKRDLQKLQNIMIKYLKPYTSYNSIEASFYSLMRTIYNGFGGLNRHFHLNMPIPTRRVSPSGGSVIAILGSDGAGKSTTLEYISKELSKKLDIYNVYMGSGDGSCSILRWPMKLIAKKVGGKGLGESVTIEEASCIQSGKKLSVKAKLYSVAKIIWAVTLAYEKKSKICQITKARNRGMIVLIDRYPQTYMSGISDGPLLSKYMNSNNLILRFLAKKEKKAYEFAAINPPDLFIKLKVPAELALARKPEMTLDEILLKQNVVENMYTNIRNVEIDTSKSKEETFSLAMDSVWEVI